MTVLALDLGSHMGFAHLRADERVESGTVELAPGSRQGPGMRFVKMRTWLAERKKEDPALDRIVYEHVMFMGTREGVNHTTHPLQLYGGCLAILQMFCELNNMAYEGFNVSTVKLRFAGSGKATKEDMMGQCRMLGFAPKNDNEADAIAVLHVATGREPLLTMCGASKKKPAKLKPAITSAPASEHVPGTMPVKPF